MSSRHVKSFSNIRIDLLEFILVTFATSHCFRSPLKVEAPSNTVPSNTVARKKKADYIHTTTRKKRKVKHNRDQNTQTPQRRQTFFKLHTSRNRIKAKQAYNRMRTSHYGQKAWNLTRKSHHKSMQQNATNFMKDISCTNKHTISSGNRRRKWRSHMPTNLRRKSCHGEATFTYKTDYYHPSINPLLPNPYWKICGHKHVIL